MYNHSETGDLGTVCEIVSNTDGEISKAGRPVETALGEEMQSQNPNTPTLGFYSYNTGVKDKENAHGKIFRD